MSRSLVRVGIAFAVLAVLAGAGWWFHARPPALAEGEDRLSQGDVAAARRVAEHRLKADPDESAAWVLLARCAEAEANWLSAADAYAKAAPTAEPAEQGDLSFRRALVALRGGDQATAEGLLTALLKERPDDEAVQTELQWLYFNQLRERDVERLLESLLKRNPTRHALLLHLLRSVQRRPMAPEAVSALERANTAVPGQTQVELALARCASRLGQPERANELSARVARREGRSLETALVQAEVLLDQGRAEDARAALQPPPEAGKAWRRDDRWWWFTAQAALQEKDWPQALAALETADRLRPGEVAYVNALATVLQALNRPEAVAVQERARELADASRALYILDSEGAVDRPTAESRTKIARHLRTLGKETQARGWERLVGLRSSP